MPERPYETGDVVWAPDPYHDDDPALQADPLKPRPWLVLSTAAYPNQGEDSVCCALTSNARPDPVVIPLEAKDWVKGGPTKPGRSTRRRSSPSSTDGRPDLSGASRTPRWTGRATA